MTRGAFGIALAGTLLLIGIAFFPGIKTVLGVSTSGFPDLLAAIVTGFPYILVGFIILAAAFAAKFPS